MGDRTGQDRTGHERSDFSVRWKFDATSTSTAIRRTKVCIWEIGARHPGCQPVRHSNEKKKANGMIPVHDGGGGLVGNVGGRFNVGGRRCFPSDGRGEPEPKNKNSLSL